MSIQSIEEKFHEMVYHCNEQKRLGNEVIEETTEIIRNNLDKKIDFNVGFHNDKLTIRIITKKIDFEIFEMIKKEIGLACDVKIMSFGFCLCFHL
jgi:hypothetical protein